MRAKGFSFEEIALRFCEKDIPLKPKDVADVFESEKKAILENKKEDEQEVSPEN